VDEVTKYRMTGAIIWLTLLILIVPSWYSHPVDYAQVHPWLAPVDDRLIPVVEAKNETHAPLSEPPTPTKQVLVTHIVPTPPADVPTALATETPKTKPIALPPEQTKTESVETNTPVTPVASVEKLTTASTPKQEVRWYVRLVSYQSQSMAEQLLARLQKAGYQASIGQFSSANRPIYSVRVGPYDRQDKANAHKQALDKQFKTQSLVIEVRE
jgi:cell division septation protein DedD